MLLNYPADEDYLADEVYLGATVGRYAGRLSTPDPQLKFAGGYDHFFLLNNAVHQSEPAAMVFSPESGIRMKLFTDQPGVQFYSGNWLDQPFAPNGGLCLELQNIPNAPNMDGFPSTILRPGESYRRLIALEFEC